MMLRIANQETQCDEQGITVIDDLIEDIMPYWNTENAAQIVTTVASDKQEMLENSPWKFLQNYYTLGQEHNHFKHAMKSCVKLQVTHSNHFGMHSLSICQGCWFSDTPNVTSTNEIITAAHGLHPFKRWSKHENKMVPCSKWFPFAFELNGIQAYFIDQDGSLTHSVNVDISNIQRFDNDSAILRVDSDSSNFGSSAYMIPPNNDELKLLEKEYNEGIFGWCFSLYDENISPDSVKPLNWAKNEDSISHKELCNYYKLKGKSNGQGYEAMQVSVGTGIGYDSEKDLFSLRVEALGGMSGGPIVSTILPPNVLAGIGNIMQGEYCPAMQGLHSFVRKSCQQLKRAIR